VRIPTDAIIPTEKLTHYLLAPRRKSDKSRFLAQAGFSPENYDLLEHAIRRLIAEYDAVSDRGNEYGVFYRVEGLLHGPEGVLSTVTVWIQYSIDGSYHFVTLKPAR
jgi:hypothetical protein